MFPIQTESSLYEVNLIETESGSAEQQALILQLPAHTRPGFYFSVHINIYGSVLFCFLAIRVGGSHQWEGEC